MGEVRLIRKETAVSESSREMAGVLIGPVTGEITDHKELAKRLLAQAKEQGLSIVGRGRAAEPAHESPA